MNVEGKTAKSTPRPRIYRTLWAEMTNPPNVMTLARIAVVPIICWLITFDKPGYSFIAVILFSLAAVTDFLDGFIARRFQMISIIGKFLDPLADKLIVLAVLIVLAGMDRVPMWLVILIMAREITITGLRAIASSEGMVIAARSLGKYKTAFQLTALPVLITHHVYIINYGVALVELDMHRIGMTFLYIAFFFSITSALDYFYGFVKAMKVKREAV